MRHADDGTLNAWLDGALSPEDAAAVAVHLEHCDACRTRLTQASSWRLGAASLLGAAAPSDVNIPPFERVLERAAAQRTPGPQPIVHHRPGALLQPLPAWSTLTWAATIVLALLIGWYGRELVLRQSPPRSESGRVAGVATPAAASAPTAPAAAPTGKGNQLAAPSVIPPDLPPPAPSRVAASRQADYAGQAAPSGVVAAPGAIAAARDTGARAEVAVAPAAAPVTAERAERARGFAQQRDAAKPAAAESARAIAVRGAAAQPLAAVPESLLGGRRLEAARRGETAMSLLQREAASEPAGAKAFNVTAQSIAAAPTFTPYTVAPVLRNREDVQRAQVAFYPPIERENRIGGTTTVWLFLSDQGSVLNTRVKQSSGRSALDSAALRVARTMRFSPALNRDQRVPVWVALPIVFKTTLP